MISSLFCSFKKVKSFTVPTKAYSASLHPSKSTFVVGGEDFKIYKFGYEDGKELGKLIPHESQVLSMYALCKLISSLDIRV